jgi:hypothetical protein
MLGSLDHQIQTSSDRIKASHSSLGLEQDSHDMLLLYSYR